MTDFYLGNVIDENKTKSDTATVAALLTGTDVLVDANVIHFCAGVNSDSIAKFNSELRKLDVKLRQETISYNCEPIRIKLHISSYGGSIFSGVSAMDAILNCKSPVDTIVDGYVASAGTFLSIVGTKRYMYKHSYMLVHQLSSKFWGKMSEFEDNKENLDRLHEMIKRFYMEYTTLPTEQLEEIMKHDLWWDAETCLKFGLIDEIFSNNWWNLMSQNGKGDKPRKVNITKYEQNYEKIFGNKTENTIRPPECDNSISGSVVLVKAVCGK